MKRLITLLSLAIFAQVAFGQLTGTKNIPGDYGTLALAITDLNTQGVGTGGVIINLLAGNPETAPVGGYVIGNTGSLVLTTTSVSNQVTIQGNGNTITAPNPQTSGNLNDAIFKLIGADWITITGFTMNENAANTTTTAGTNNMTEWGVALLYVTITDGAQNNTISGCTIDLDRTYQNTFGIYSNSTHSATSVTTSATATGTAGGNSGLVIAGNTVTDVNQGIVVVGPTAAADHNEGVTIGGSSMNANLITNYGTTGTFSGYANVSGTVNGILMRNTRNFNISYNTVTSSNGGTIAGTLNGIHIPAFSNAPTGTFTNSISNNTISVRSGLIAGAMNGINHPSGSASATSTLNINYNNFENCGHTVSGTAAIIFILNGSTHLNQSISYNTFTNISVNTTGNVTFISHSYSIPSTGQCIINNNSIVTAFNKTGAGGTVTLTTTNGSSGTGSVNNYTNNNFSNISVTGATAITGFNNTDGGAGSTKTITGNTFNSWTGGTSAINTMNFTYWNGVSSLSNNTITNISGQGAITGITLGSAANNATSIAVSSNIINNLSSTGTGGTVIGISSSNTSSGINISGNTINTLSTTNTSGVVSGISIGGGSTLGINKNKIFDLSGNQTGTTINGINITLGTTFNISNNLIGDLRATAGTGLDCIRGINASATSTYNVYYNTIYLAATSSGATFGNSCITWSSSVTSFNHRNNILVNLSTPGTESANLASNGIAACLRRTGGTTGTVPTNYATTSNNNDFWCNPTAGTNNHLTYVEGSSTITNPQNTVANLITFMANRDQASIGENPTFLSTTGSNSTFLHINTTISTGIESGGNNITSYTDDYDNDIRQGNSGYSGTGTAPDIGADEFAGTPSYTCTAPTPGNTVSSANNICLGQSITLSLQNPISGTGNTYRWQSSVNGSSYDDISMATSSTYTTTPTAALYYQCIVTCQNGPVSATSTPVQVTFSNNILTTTPGSRCGTGTVNLAATTSAGTLTWYAAATGGSSLGTGSPFTTPSISATTTYYVGAETATSGTGTLGTGTGTNTTTTYPAAYGSYWGNVRSQYLILASELISAGLSAGNLNTLAFDVTALGSPLTLTGYTITIGTTSAASITTWQTLTSPIVVFGPTNYTPVVGSYASNTHTFTTPFNWNGTSNIIVELCFNNGVTGSTNTLTRLTTTSYSSSIYYGVDGVVTGGVCGTTSLSSSSLSRPNMQFSGTLICSSPRSSVVATVDTPPVLTVSANQTICNNSVATLAVTSAPLTDFDSYTWSPLSGLFTDDLCTAAYTGTSATTVYFKSVTAGVNTFTCTANNSVTGCANTAQSVVTNLPVTTVITASPSYLCLSGTSTLTSVPASGYGSATFQWQDSPDNGTFSDISGANAISYTTPTLTSTTYYKLLVKLGTNTCYESNVATVTVSNPQVTGTTPDSRCGTGTVSLEATATGGSLKWYAASTGGSPLGSGSPFVTPIISTTTSFYAGAETYSPGSSAVGAGATTSATYSNPFYSLWSNNHTQHLITAAELAAAGLSAGNLTSVALDVTSAGTLPMIDLSVKIAHTTATSLTAFLAPTFTTVYTNASMMPVAGLNVLTFSTPFAWDGTSNIVLEFCHGNGSSSATMSRTVKADNTAYNSSIRVYVGAATPAATVCADVITNLLTYTVRPQFTFGGQTVCSSARSSVLATVTPPPALTITAGQTICNNSALALAVTSTIGDYDSYVWSPQTNLFTDEACGNSYTGGTATTVYFKSATGGAYTITCNATNSVSECSNVATCDVTNLPATVTVTAAPSNHCLSGSSILTAVPATGYGTATFQWQDSPDNINFTDIPGANAISYTTPTLTSTTYYKLLIKLGTNVCTGSNSDTVTVNNPQVIGTTPGSRCGIGTVSLAAAASDGSTLKWYAAETGGTALGTGSPFTTPEISTSTTFYVGAESTGSVNEIGGRTNVVSTSGFLTTNWGILFNVSQALTLNSTTIYPAGTGTVTIALQNSSGTELAVTSAIPVTGSGYTTPVVVNLGFSVPVGTGYRLVLKSYSGITDLIRESTNTFPYTSPSGAISVTNGWSGSSSTSYYWFYSLNVGIGCASSRTSVLATVNAPPELTITPSQNVCTGYITSMSVTSTETNYETYTWSPVTGLYTDNLCLDPYEALEDLATVYVKLSAAGPVVYTCTGTQTSGLLCASTTTSTVTGLATPPAPTTTGYSMCIGGTIPVGQGLQSTAVGAPLTTGSQTINFDVSAQPVETNAAPGNIVASAIMAALPAGATVTSIVITYNGIEALGTSWQSDVKLGFSGSIVNSAAGGTGAANAAGIFNYTRTASTGITSVNAGGTVNLLYWDAVSNNTGDEATFPFALTQDASLVINYSYPDPAAIQWYTAPTGGAVLGTGSPFNPIGVDPLLPNSNVPGTYTYYAEVLNGTCASPRTSCDLEIGTAVATTAIADPSTPVCSGTEVTLMANPSGGGVPYTYEWKVGGNVVKTIQSFDTTLTATTTFNLKVTDNCSQVAYASITVTVNPIPTASASSNSPVCAGQTLNLTGTTDIGTSYSWTGPNGFTSLLQNPSITNVTTAASGTYSFYATASGCTSPAGTVNVVINQTPSAVVITPSAATIDYGDVQQLVASGGSLTGVSILAENFNGATNNWTTINNSTGGTPADAAWTLRADGYIYSSTTYHSNDNSQFYMSNSDDHGFGGITETILKSPSFSTTGFTSASVSFYHYFRYTDSESLAKVEASTDGNTWTTLQTYNSTQGTASAFVNASVSLTAPFIGQPTVYIRYKYNDTYGWYWAIDNVSITGTGAADITWSPIAGLFTDEEATIAYVEDEATTSVYASPAATTIYTATATSVNGCENSEDVTVTVIQCTAPTGLTANGIGINNANLTWTPGATESNWEYAYGEAPFAAPAGAGTATSSNTTNPISGLDPNTDYQFYVRSVCGTNYSGWSSAGNFTTLCGNVTSFPYTVGFEGTWPPACWTDDETANYGWNQSSAEPYAGARHAYCNLQNSALITPGLVLATDSRLVFWFRVEDAEIHQDMAVKIGDDIIYQISDASITTYQEVQVSLAAYTGQTVSISFVGGTGNGDNDKGIYLDDVTIRSNTNYWTGDINTEWNNSGNWSAGFVPDQYDRVIIPSSPTANHFPVVPAGTWSCYGLTLESGAEIDILGTLNVLNP